MRKTLSVFALVASLLLNGTAQAAIKPGTKCLKAGAFSTSAGKKFTCIKSGKNLVWNKGVLIKKPTAITPEINKPTPEPTPSATPKPQPENSAVSFDPGSLPIGLNQPTEPKSSINKNSYNITFKVSEEALGGYLESKELGLNSKNSYKVKSSSGIVEVTGEIPANNTIEKAEVYIYAYSEKFKSSCCFSIGIELVVKNSKKTNIYSGLDIFEYQTPLKITTKPTSVLSKASNFSNLTPCRLKDGDPILDNMTVGFPLPSGRTDQTKPVKVAVLAADFPDVQASTKPADDYKKAIDTMKHFWESQASNGLVINVETSQSYKRMPKKITEYELGATLNGFKGDNYWLFIQQVIDAYDAEVNFTGVSTIVVVVPLQVTREQLGTWVVNTQETFKTNEGNVYNVMITGNGDSKAGTSAWVHEYGHTLGLTDMRYVNATNAEIQRPEGLGIYDIMGSGSAAAETLVWSRFLTGVLLPNQIHCVQSPEPSTHWLIPIAQQLPDLKGVVIPLDEYRAIVVESRRNYGYDTIGTDAEGVLVYTIDTRKPYLSSPAFIVSPSRSTDLEWYTDSALKLGESVTTNGWKITVVETGEFGDVIKAEKVN